MALGKGLSTSAVALCLDWDESSATADVRRCHQKGRIDNASLRREGTQKVLVLLLLIMFDSLEFLDLGLQFFDFGFLGIELLQNVTLVARLRVAWASLSGSRGVELGRP